MASPSGGRTGLERARVLRGFGGCEQHPRAPAFAFRTVAVVTGDDTDPDYIKQSTNASGTASHGLYLRVNGAAALGARGANVVPTEVLEGRDTAERQQRLVASAAAAGFNTVRVWGGGVS